jgi:fructokinase
MIVSCGEALVDLVPEPTPGGGPMNAAIAAARLGAPAAFVGCVSTDAYGDLLWSHLLDNGVELSLVTRSAAPTARAIVEHVPQLRFRFEGEGTADTLLDRVDLDRLGTGPHIVHGGTLGLFRGRTADTLASLVEAHDGIVSLDPNVRPQIITDRDRWDRYHERWLGRADLYKASDEDLGWIWPGRRPESVAEEQLAAGLAAFVVTKGADGLTIHTAHGEASARPPEITVVDTVGAGDTIAGAILVSMWELAATAGRPLSDVTATEWEVVARRAVDAAAVTCSRAGADPPLRTEIPW